MKITSSYTRQFLQIVLNKPFENISDEDLSKLKNLSFNSQELGVEKAEIEFSDIISKCSSLKQLTLKNTILTPTVIEIIDKLSLDSLYLEKCAFSDDYKISFPQTLKILNMKNCFLDDYSSLLNALPKSIETIDINFPADESVIRCNQLNNLPLLTYLILNGCIIDFDGTYLSKCNVLQLFNTALTPKSIKIITSFPELKKVYISENFLHLQGIEELKSKCKVKTNLIEFAFDDDEKEPLIKK